MRTRVSRQWEIRVGQTELVDGANKSCLCILFVLIYLLSEQLLSLSVQLTAGPRAAQIQLSSASWPLKHGQSCGQRLRGSQLTRTYSGAAHRAHRRPRVAAPLPPQRFQVKRIKRNIRMEPACVCVPMEQSTLLL